MNRALLVGINTYPVKPLRGCVNDVNDMADFLIAQCGFAYDDIRKLVDERATKAAIMERLGWLLTGIGAGDRILFFYSGHGTQMATRNPQGEVDRLDEVICPVDFNILDAEEYRVIRDKEFRRIFSAIPEGVEFVWVSDSCHSQDLSKDINMAALPRPGTVSRCIDLPADMEWRVVTAGAKGITAEGLGGAASKLNLALLAACGTTQEAADAPFGERYNGAFTFFLLKRLRSEGIKSSLKQLVQDIDKDLAQAHITSQNPAIEGNEDIQKRPFLMVLQEV